MNCSNNNSRHCCNNCGSGSYGTYVTIQGPMGPQDNPGSVGPQGPKGERGEKGERGPAGEQGPAGAQGPQGELGPQGVQGDRGCPGEQGIQGEKGDTGETPAITVVEDTPLSYKLNFKISTTDITTPNLFKALDEYHINLSTANSTLNIPLDNLILTYQYVSSNSARITIAPKDTSISILADMRRTSIYNSYSVESQTYDNTNVSTRTILNDIIYTLSQETHVMQIRQQNPDTKLWSLCEIHTFISNGGARTSVWVQWYESGVSYEAP